MVNYMNMRQKMLVVAPHVPRYDQHSGHLRLFSILEILSRKYEITYLATTGSEKADHGYISDLTNLGIRVFMGGHSLRRILAKNRFNLAILEFFFIAEYYLPRIRILQPECLVIIDSVDVRHLRERLKYEITGKEDDLKRSIEIKNRELNIYKKADRVLAITGEDANVLRKDCPDLRVEVVPNIHRLQLGPDKQQKNSLIFVGGFLHNPNIDAVLYFCKKILPLVKKKLPHVELAIVGSHPPEEIRQLRNSSIEVTGYVSSTTPYLHRSYISVAPLRYGAGMKGKIGEAMAHGVPVVTTLIGAQGMNLKNGEDAMIADSPAGFSESIIELVQNDDLYKRIQNNSIEYVKGNLTPDAVKERIFAVVEKLEDETPQKMTFREKLSFFFNYGVQLLNMCKRQIPTLL